MILVTVGTDMPFDRLVKVVDSWAAENGRGDVFAQIGAGGWQPRNIRFADFLKPPEFVEIFSAATVIVSHAGMGTILSALHYGKPILVMPKRASLGEHRNEHQLATARRMMDMGKVNVAFDEDQLRDRLNHLSDLKPGQRIGSFASDNLVKGIHNFIHNSETPH
jgi:UDP-N-acetylglucosamine transferase subunit ALG13